MEYLWSVIAVLLSPFGEGCQKVMMKILKCLNILDLFGSSAKQVADAVIIEKIEKNKHFEKVVVTCCLILFTGGLYLYWLLLKWSFKLFAKLFRAIFRKRA